MCDHSELRNLCRQKQEEQIILRLSETTGMSLDRAMATYYASALSRQIEEGVCGLDNLDAAYLVEDLIENEPELFAERGGI